MFYCLVIVIVIALFIRNPLDPCSFKKVLYVLSVLFLVIVTVIAFAIVHAIAIVIVNVIVNVFEKSATRISSDDAIIRQSESGNEVSPDPHL